MFRIFAWIPDIFPEIQEKFREDGSIIHSCNKAIPDIFPEIQEKFREDGSIIHSCNKATLPPINLVTDDGIVENSLFPTGEPSTWIRTAR